MQNKRASKWKKCRKIFGIWPGRCSSITREVKALVRQAGLKIIDANVAVGRANAAEGVPEVTIKAV